MEFRTLKENEIDVRVGNAFSTGYTLLLYKDARCDMNILDECVGAENWQRDHKEIKGNLYCGVGINCGVNEFEDILDYNGKAMGKKITKTIDRWVWKWDCGTESNTEKEKGEASDSFKRACVNWGIGRELYTSPLLFIECVMEKETDRNGKIVYKLPSAEKKRKFKVIEIEYNDKREIIKLVIVDNKGTQVYPKQKVVEEKKSVEVDCYCNNCGASITEKVASFSKSKFGVELCYNCQKNLPVEELEI